METLWQDIRHGLRLLSKNAGFTAIAVLTLALGIGANSALFSVVNGVLLDPLPFPRSQELTAVYWKTAQFEHSSITFPNFLDWQRDNRTFAAMAAYRGQDYSWTGASVPEHLRGQQVSAEFFPLLGVQPVLGRTFRPEEDRPGGAPVVVISEGLWKRKFASSPKVLGQSITLNDVAYTVTGVVPARLPMFDPTVSTDVFVPIGQWNDPTFRDRKIGMGTQGVGRMKPGVTLDQAQADMSAIGASLAATYPDADKGTSVALVPLKQDIVGDVRGTLFVLLGAVGFVLLIACANVANLLLARSTARTREFAVRVALGASPMRVVRQLLTESVILAVSGGVLGLVLAKWGTSAILAALPAALPRADNIHLDGRVLLFTLVASLFAGIIFGLAPALKTARPDVAGTLKEGGRGGNGARHRTQNVFVVVEMTLSVVLLVGAGLMIRSLAALGNVNPGFNPRNVVAFSVGFSPAKLTTAAKIRAQLHDTTANFESVSGVEAASATAGAVPMQGDSELPFWLEGHPKPATTQEMSEALWYGVQPDYLKAMGIPLVRGRFISSQDDEKAPMVMVIDQIFARQYFPNEDPIGKRINLELLSGKAEVVGVVGHVKHWGLGDTGHQNLQAEFYTSLAQVPDQILPLAANGIGMIARTAGKTEGFTGAIRAASTRFDSSQVVYDFNPMEKIVADSIATQRFTMVLLGVFAALALILSSVGIYGVISYVASQRTHEIGIRMALGAQPRDVLRIVLRNGMRFALIGVVIGIVAALVFTRFIAKIIYGVGANDPITFTGVAILLTLVALAACYIPARRAMGVDPIIALRYE